MPADTAVWADSAGDPAAPSVLLIHGSMDRSAGLLRLSRRLAAGRHVVRFDRRGYGRSRAVGPPWTVAANVDDADGLLEELPAGTDVVGHSFGGNVALALAARRPDRIRSVVVYETPLSWLDWWPGNSAGAAAMAADSAGDAAEAFMRRLVGDDVWERLPAARRQERREEGAAMVAELADLRASAPWSPEMITVPVLALVGALARPHHRAAGDWLVEHLPDCRRRVVAEAGHAGPHTHAAAVAGEIEGFLTTIGRGVVASG
jgi:pimeloyl-ACP methyl ester carboxylesterase